MIRIEKKQKSSFDVRRIIFWEPCTSPHKADFFSALAKIAPEIEVICCADRDLPEDRKVQGWSIQPNNEFQTIIAPTFEEVNLIINQKLDSTLHVFSGLRRVPTILAAIKVVKKLGAKFAIWHEPRVREGWKGELRFVQSWICERWFRRRAEFVLAIGRNGPNWFKSVGYPLDRIFPFAYFVDSLQMITESDSSTRPHDEAIQIGYVGRLVKEKGIFDLVNAVAKLGKLANLHIVGTGIEQLALQDACDDLKVAAHFHGVLPMNDVSDFMSRLDVLVLVSTTEDDGWGVVVSEALMVGTSVILTPCVGASVLLINEIFGRCVPARSPDAITKAIIELELSGTFSNEQRRQRAIYARQCLSPNNGARHLLEIIRCRFTNSVRPIPFYEI
jgi:glycosyltransferase involved in cell wall biosynthesis